MLMPSIFGENLFDDFFEYPRYTHKETVGNLMQTDIIETDAGYEFIMNLPGVKKENVQIEFEKGYLTIHVNADPDEKDEKGKKYICHERYTGGCSRRFYVGDQITDKDIKARFEDGTLKLSVTKPTEEQQSRLISIEG